MRFELGHVPMADGYGEGILPLDACKEHLRVTHDEEDALIEALRDASIEYVEKLCELKLGPVEGMTWRAERFPHGDLDLAVRPIGEITSVAWLDGSGSAVTGEVADFRVSERGVLRPAIGGFWPLSVGGDVVVTFNAGYAEGEAPRSLISAVKLMLGHLYMNREAVVTTGTSGEVPLGVTALCSPFRPLVI